MLLLTRVLAFAFLAVAVASLVCVVVAIVRWSSVPMALGAGAFVLAMLLLVLYGLAESCRTRD